MQPLIPPFIQQKLIAGELHGELRAFTLNIDLSGFTPLTETLMQQGLTGAEQLSMILNEVFEPLVALVYASGGIIPYFAGDAFTAVFPLPLDRVHAMHLLRTAERARQLFRDRGNKFGNKFRIGIKAGVAAGTVRYGIVGEELRAFYFRGPAIDQAAKCQTLAGEQEIVVSDFVHTLIEGSIVYTEEVATGAYRVLGDVSTVIDLEIEPVALPVIDAETAVAFLPPEVVRYDQAGEFRTVVSCFLSFDAVRTHDELDQFATVVLNQVKDFGGYFKEVDYGDKGALMVIFFGAPVSYENNVTRAVEFALVVQQELEALSASTKRSFRFRMGMTVGTAFTGIVGGKERAQYACVGNRVNLAARIMAEADWKEVLVDGEIAANPQFRFMPKGKLRYKGIKEPEATFALEGRRQSIGKPSYGGKPIGRNEEIARLLEFSAPLHERRPAGIAHVRGEAGIGKSRLTYELRHRMNKIEAVNWLLGSCDQILRKSFNPFTYMLERLFRQSIDLGTEQNLRRFQFKIDRLQLSLQRRGTDRARQLAEELVRTQSVLAAQLGIVMPGSLWTQLDAQGRYQNTIDGIVTLIIAECLLQPTVLELEDIHWIDEDSLTIVRELVRRIEQLPLLIVATARPDDDGQYPQLVPESLREQLQLPIISVEIGGLTTQAVRELAESTLGGAISDPTLKTLLRATNSNPFYLEQILEYFRENELLHEKSDGLLHLSDESIKLSTSITSILTARIDRLSDMVRETVKAAAVIGREFDIPVLTEVMRMDAGFNGTENIMQLLEEQIEVAERGQIWSAMNELRYIFRHSLLREAVYGMQLTTRLQQLHRQIARAIEKLYGDNIEERYVDLAFHYEHSGENEKTIEYLSKAASYARANYQNQQALDLYKRLIEKLSQSPSEDISVNIYLSQGGIYEIVGRWEEAQVAYEEAQYIAKTSRDVVLLGRTNNALGQLHTLRGEYDMAMDFLKVAAGLFESVDDIFGIARAYSNMGNLYFRTNHYDKALTYYKKSLDSGLSEAGTTTSAGTISHLGLTYMNLGSYEEAIAVIRDQIPRHEASNDKMGLATLHTNLGIVYFESGDYDLSLNHHRQGLQLARELGDRRLQAIGLGSLGNIKERQGKYGAALELYEQDLKMCYEIGDRQGIAVTEGLLGDINSVMGNFSKAIAHLDRCLSISSDLGYRKGVAKAVNTLGDIYYLQAKYDLSGEYYDQAIEIARSTNNRLVLGASLYEKGLVLLADGQLDAVKEVEREALAVAEDLGNPDVLFGARLLHARCLVAYDEANAVEAKGVIEELLESATLTVEQEAEAYLAYYNISGKTDDASRQRALKLYEQLYEETPKFVYNYHLSHLRQSA
ncbi:tetratricopeptide (TPR) repeat protein/class 3 adenylate cyclase [Lewinella aquimaris]|uniref:Tetratricopeptide (TPR) repeat protein/class 3 adenylate cyclase n=1 Tax=Neolewinella aquimaris TaxID=1835722 RepID=A0A840E7D4_9BACT|nr:tetratricopeptide repeat protein [Neolewinella aquimaris]MBB4079535.1 tetratricopeptide (TPR) repeat protein/class 3 adenylate cyclase [Neolewinella aquimaris]